MADPGVQLLSHDMRGRYVWGLCCSFLSDTPGVADEDTWRQWMGYSPIEWKRVREKHARCFRVEGSTWTQKRMFEDRQQQQGRYERASQAGSKAAIARWTSDAIRIRNA